MELRPVHDALRQQLDLAVVRLLADLAEHPRAPAGAKNKKIERQRREFFELAWTRCETLLHAAQTAYASRMARDSRVAGAAEPIDPTLLAPVFRERLNAVLHIPAMEALFPAPWTVAARRVLPSSSPQFAATAMWGPVFGWCVVQLLAESMGAEDPQRVALDLFDRLRLREPFAQAFAALGFEVEEGWRVAARIKVLLLIGAGVGQGKGAPGEAGDATADAPDASDQGAVGEDKVALSSVLWLDPDVRWLSGVHEAEGRAYLVREPYEELLWWLQLPSLLRLAGEEVVNRKAVGEISKTVAEALAAAEAAGYRIDLLLGLYAAQDGGEEPASTAIPEPAKTAIESS